MSATNFPQAPLRVGTRLASRGAKAQRCLTGVSSSSGCESRASGSPADGQSVGTTDPRKRCSPSSEPSDLAVRRSARRLSILGSRASASRLPGSARPTVDGTRPEGGDALAFFDDVSLLSLLGGFVVLAAFFFFGFCW